MTKRLPSEPPILPGFTYVSPLGTGGFADVFLFAQQMPRRQVAVKVLLKDLVDENFLKQFQKEADTMAALSSHPSIVTIYEASVSADGRPYIVMEHCPGSYGTRYRKEHISIPEVLHLGIKIGSALETAHNAGVLHRDIKPANILVTEYGAPVLSDFGIAAALKKKDSAELLAMSIPWSAPEIISEASTGSVASEVWSLGATLYSLLAGFSPFEKPGKGMNTRQKLQQRILRAKYVPVPRNDMPTRLENLLQKSLHKNSAARFSTIFELVENLQLVQQELSLTVTPAEISTSGWTPTVETSPTDLKNYQTTVEIKSGRAKKPSLKTVVKTDDGGIIEQAPQSFLRPGLKKYLIAAAIAVPALILGVFVINGALG